MSALGHKRTLRRVFTMSALPPKADILGGPGRSGGCGQGADVRFTPKSGHCRATVGCLLCAKSGLTHWSRH
jgi:hypothetical protein